MTKSESTDRQEETPTVEEGHQGPDRDTILSILAYFPIVCLLPLLQEERDPEMQRHARQGLVLFLVELLLVLLLIPGVSAFLLQLAMILCVVFAFFGAWNAWQGKFWRIPIIADLAERSRAGGDRD
jgi:uncharacterized membrane protein